jgi:hypothetical protein
MVVEYGVEHMSGDEMARRVCRARHVTEADADALLRADMHMRAGRAASIADLRDARPAVTYYACRLIDAMGQASLFA